MQDRVKSLVAAERLQFAGGGWSMNDEAAPSDELMITQMTLGHQFLKDTFGITPRVGWQIDPFGHSNTVTSLFSQVNTYFLDSLCNMEENMCVSIVV